jgi:probable phosphoglycerate mutase
MAEQFAAAYRTSGFRAIFSSPQQRALDTAAPLAKLLGITPQREEGFREIDYGAWDGKSREEVERSDGEAYRRWNENPAANAPTGGETAVAVATRTRAPIDRIRARYSEGRVLIVAHKGTIRVALCDLLGIELARFRDRLACPVASISVVEFGNRGPLLTALADRSHLTARLRELPGS